MKGRNFIFDQVHVLYHKCYKTNLNYGGSYIDSLDWKNTKKARINPINKNNNKCFQYATTLALNHEEIGKHLEKITKVKPWLININDNWERINCLSEKDDLKN